MRSTPATAPDLLPALAGIIDRATADQSGHVLVHVEGPI
jgi:hypothetical protein